MSKQDRQGVRTAAEVEQKYGLGQFMYNQNQKNQEILKGISNLGDSFSNYKNENDENVSALKENCDSLSKSLSGFQKTAEEKFKDINEKIETAVEEVSNVAEQNAKDIDDLEAALSQISSNDQKVLATCQYYMTGSQKITLSEKVSEQKNGIALVFCYYNGTGDTDWGWIVKLIPKEVVARLPGQGHTFLLIRDNFSYIGAKYLYINDGSISGNDRNDDTGTGASGITYANNKFVLRYVIGY